MGNSDITTARRYHDATKHSYASVTSSRHFLDWDNQPLPFKIYSTLAPIPLPKGLTSPSVPALEAVGASEIEAGRERAPDLETLARILFFSAGITKVKRYPGGEIQFRAAPCTGALYHIEIYLVCSDLPGLGAGVYHFSPHDFALRRLHPGDWRTTLVEASGEEPSLASAPVILVLTSTFWRNSWKYQARAYRHCFWDSGTVLANLLASAAAHQLPARLVLGFAEAPVNRLLDIEGDREAALALVALGRKAPPAVPSTSPLESLRYQTVPLSKTEVDYPAIREMATASCLLSGEEAAAWRGGTPVSPSPEVRGPLFPLTPTAEGERPLDSLEEVILRRGSTRQFAREAVSFTHLSSLLDAATRGIAADFLEPSGTSLNDLYLIIQAVDGLVPGAYVYHRERKALELLKAGGFRQEAGSLALGQELAADASANVYMLCDLQPVLQRFGNRGYRAAQLEGGVLGGRLYLAAYAQRLGATGLTFFDDDVTEFFSPHAAGKSVMFLMAVGRSAQRAAEG